MNFASIFVLALAFVVLLVVGRFLFSILSLAIPIGIAIVIGLFALDKARGGMAIDQLAERIELWVSSKRGG
jgi:hypothetical protein